MTTLLPHIQIDTGPSPQASVIWLHGLGADGNDFAALVPELDLDRCPPIRFIFPHAPSLPVTINGGYVMPAWYDIRGSNLTSQQDDAGIRASEKAICALLNQELTRGIPATRIVLAGFSQGCAMALHTGLRFPKRLAGIVALSGYLPLADRFAAERAIANSQTPVFMAHGDQDAVVVPERGEASRDLLENLGYAVRWHTYPMPHSVHPLEIADISTFLTDVLTPQTF
jgi:phospholipase/carboxylesterase